MNIKVSLVLTYYNGSKYLHEQLESISDQCLKPDEIIVMDDCSKSIELEFLKCEIEKCGLNDITTVVTNQNNLGYAENFHKGIRAAHGDYIFLCDQDDIWLESKIDEMADILDRHSEINLLCCDLEPFYSDENAPRWDPHSLKDMINNGSIEKCIDIKKNHHLRRSGCTMAFRKHFFQDIDRYWIAQWPHDDFLWKMAVYSGHCAIYHKILHRRRLHLNNTSEIKIRTLKWRIQELQSMLEYHRKLLLFVKDMGLSEKKGKYIEYNIHSLKLRIEFLISKNPLIWLRTALFYSDTFTGRWKGILLDAYLAYFGTLKGGSL